MLIKAPLDVAASYGQKAEFPARITMVAKHRWGLSAPSSKKRKSKKHLDELLDEVLDETFPASDAVAMREQLPARPS